MELEQGLTAELLRLHLEVGVPVTVHEFRQAGRDEEWLIARAQRAAAIVAANGDVLLIVEGHCDERGTEAYNLALGERRARSARDYLVAQGVAANRITTIAYGEERPVCREHNEGCWVQNRRAAFIVKPK